MNYIFVNVNETQSLRFLENGKLVEVMVDSDLFSDEDLGFGLYKAKLVVFFNDYPIFIGGIVCCNRIPELIIVARHRDNDFEELNWREISSDPNLTEEFIETYKNDLNWYELSCQYPMSEEFMERYIGKINWSAICSNQKLSEEFVERHEEKIVWYDLHHSQDFSEKFLEKHLYRMENVV